MIVEVENVSKNIGSREIIHNLSFSLEKGRTLALLGPNGAGKTTTIRLITGLLEVSSGQIELFGTKLDTKNSDKLREKIGVQNDGNLYENLTIGQNLDLWGQIYGIKRNERKQQIKSILEFFDLEDRINSNVGELSKGMRQKVSIARAIFHNPELLILDEPTSGLDPQSTQDLTRYLKKLVKQSGISIIMCTHQLQGLEEIADDIGIIKKGSLIRYGSADEIVEEEFPDTIYEIEATPKEKAGKLCQRFGRVYFENSSDENIRLSIKDNISISQIIKELVKSDIEIETVFKIRHTIKDSYFKIVGENKND